jgi:hypothetical protein
LVAAARLYSVPVLVMPFPREAVSEGWLRGVGGAGIASRGRGRAEPGPGPVRPGTVSRGPGTVSRGTVAVGGW